MIKQIIQTPVLRPGLDLIGRIAQSYFSSSVSNAQLRRKEARWSELFPFLDAGNNRLADPEFLATLNFVEGNLVPGNILDIGYYDGLMLKGLAAKGYLGVGVDHIHRKRINYLPHSNGSFMVTAYAERLPFGLHQFQNVVLSHSLEHVLDPEKTLAEVNRVLAEEGRIIVVVPKEKGNKPTHLRGFTKKDLMGVMGKWFNMQYYEANVGVGQGYVGTKKLG